MLNTFAKQAAQAITRAAILWIAAKIGAQTPSDDTIREITVNWVIPGAVIAWSLWQKYHQAKRLDQAHEQIDAAARAATLR